MKIEALSTPAGGAASPWPVLRRTAGSGGSGPVSGPAGLKCNGGARAGSAAAAGGAWALPVVQRMLYSEDGQIRAGGGRIRVQPVAPACFLWWQSSLGRILMGRPVLGCWRLNP
jgi:hypothetical protein